MTGKSLRLSLTVHVWPVWQTSPDWPSQLACVPGPAQHAGATLWKIMVSRDTETEPSIMVGETGKWLPGVETHSHLERLSQHQSEVCLHLDYHLRHHPPLSSLATSTVVCLGQNYLNHHLLFTQDCSHFTKHLMTFLTLTRSQHDIVVWSLEQSQNFKLSHSNSFHMK